MYLFLTRSYSLDTGTIRIDDKDFIHQVSRVLRMQTGDKSYLQWFGDTTVLRVQITFKTITKNYIDCVIIDTQERPKSSITSRIAIARPNKKDKLELIAQKLTELGVDEINFFRSERSQWRPLKPKQKARIDKIVTEAVEQSRSWNFPSIHYYENIADIPNVDQYYLFATPDDHLVLNDHGALKQVKFINHTSVSPGSQSLFCVGPEGGWGPDDYTFFAGNHTIGLSLGSQILRMETASIVAGWILVDAVRVKNTL